MLRSPLQYPSAYPPWASAISLLTISMLGGAFLGSLGFASPANAASRAVKGQVVKRKGELRRWVPSVAFFGGVQEQEAEGTITSGPLMGPRCFRQPPNRCVIDEDHIRPGSDGDDDIRAVRLGLSAELMTPRLSRGLGKPRLFLHVDPMYSIGFDRTIAGEGNPGSMDEPDLPPGVSTSDEALWSGQGSRILAEVEPFVLGVGIGVAVTMKLFDKRIRIKPSFEYLAERLKVTGKVNRVVQVVQDPVPGRDGDFRQIALQDEYEKTYHAIGPALEIEVDADRFGPFVVTPFVSGRAYRFFGNLDVDLSDSNEYDETADWAFTRDRWEWDMRVGLRLRWLPR